MSSGSTPLPDTGAIRRLMIFIVAVWAAAIVGIAYGLYCLGSALIAFLAAHS